jgi:hypothetical protein
MSINFKCSSTVQLPNTKLVIQCLGVHGPKATRHATRILAFDGTPLRIEWVAKPIINNEAHA